MYKMALICVSLKISDSQHFLIDLLAFCVPSLEKGLFKPLPHFLFKLSVFIVELSEFFIYAGYEPLSSI